MSQIPHRQEWRMPATRPPAGAELAVRRPAARQLRATNVRAIQRRPPALRAPARRVRRRSRATTPVAIGLLVLAAGALAAGVIWVVTHLGLILLGAAAVVVALLLIGTAGAGSSHCPGPFHR